MSTLKPLQVDIVSDVVCPWCYIGKRRIENALALAPDGAGGNPLRPFFLQSVGAGEGISRDEYLTAKFGSVEAYKASPDAWSPRRAKRACYIGPIWSSASPTPPTAIA